MVELAVIATDKGHALDLIRHQDGATAAVFIGDDVTDEKAFSRLQGPDIGIKVGSGGHRRRLSRRQHRGCRCCSGVPARRSVVRGFPVPTLRPSSDSRCSPVRAPSLW